MPDQYSAREKVALAALLMQTTSVTNAWLAEWLHMVQPASMSQYVRRFRNAGKTEKRGYRAALSKVNPLTPFPPT
jgi:hypothetical protein